MSKEQEDLIIALIAQAREEQGLAAVLLDQAEALDKSVNTICEQIKNTRQQISKEVSAVLGVIPDELRQGAQAGAKEAVQGATGLAVDGLREATKGLSAAAAEGRATAKAISHEALKSGVVLLAIALVIVGLGYFVALPLLIQGYADDLADIKAQVEAEKATLARLQSETWQLELVEYQDGSRGILLPKGVKVDRTGPLKDGRVGIVIITP